MSRSDLDVALEAIEKWYAEEKGEAFRLLKSTRQFTGSKINELLNRSSLLPNFDKMEESALRFWLEAMDDFTCDIGWIYTEELQNPEVAIRCIEQSVKAGFPRAMNALGVIYERTKELKKAEEWYFKAAGKGYFRAMNNLGLLYQKAYKDFQKAKEWWFKAAKSGDLDAMFNLGWLFQFEYKDIKQAEKWYLKSAAGAHSMAMHNLGWLYQNNYKNYQKAKEWYLLAAEKDHLIAMYNLGWLYKNVYKDIQKAEEWYLKAARKGSLEAMRNLGLLYKNEYRNFQKAEEWYLKAIENGYSITMCNLGWLYKNEYKDIQKALEWYLKAAESGHTRGMNALAWHFFEQKMEKGKALEWALKANKEEADEPNKAHTFACILLWHSRAVEAFEVAKKFVWEKEIQEDENNGCILFFTLALAKNQAQPLYNLFTSPQGQEQNFKDRYKPIWYAILKKLDHPDYLRMGDELTQTVEEVLAKADQMAIDYK